MIPHTEAGKGALVGISRDRPQQTFRVGYDMQVAELDAGEDEQKAHYAGIKSRLWGKAPAPTRPVRRLPPPPVSGAPVATVRKSDLPVFLKDVVHPLPSPMAWRAIVSEVCIAHGVTYLQLCSIRRDIVLVAARHEAAYRLHHETTMSFPQIGLKLGGRDHTTILYAVRRHEAKLRGEVYRQPARSKVPASQ